MDMYTKLVLGSRTGVPLHVTSVLSKSILKCVTHELFKDDCLPAIERSMLRNPESILTGLSFLLCTI